MLFLKKLLACIAFCSPDQPSSLPVLPNEIFLQIVTYLEFKDLKSITCLDKYYNNLMKTDGFKSFIKHNKKKALRKLNSAAFLGKVTVMQGLIQYMETNQNNDLPYALMLALVENNNDIALLLINKGVNINARFNHFSDPLSIAIHNLQVARLVNNYTIHDLELHYSLIAALIDKGAIIKPCHIQHAEFILNNLAEKLGPEKVTSSIAKLPKLEIMD